MRDQDKTQQQLIDELDGLRRRNAELEHIDAQHRQTEEELAKSKAILTAAVECLPFDFYALDTDGRCILQNAVSRRYFGDAVGKTAEEVCPDEEALVHWLEGNRRALAGARVEQETQLQVAGEHRHFFSLLAPIQNGGTLYGILGVNVDITARKRAEEALRESEARYRALAESTTDIIYILDRKGTLLYANRTASQWIGIPCNEIAGKRQEDLFPPEVAQAHVKRIERVFATGEVLERDEQFHFGPEQVWLRVHLLPLRDETEQVTSVMGLAHNITERKRAEEALRKAHADLEKNVQERTAELTTANKELTIFRKFADTSAQGFSMADLDGHITYLNPALCRILGEERAEDVIGKHLSIHFSEETNRRGKQEIEPALNREGYWEGELPMLSRQGASIPTWHHTFLIRDEHGSPFRLGVVITDISERKAAQEALQQSHDQLQTIYEGMVEGLLITDIQTKRFIRVNSALCRMLGYSEEDLLAASIKDIHPPEEVPNDLTRFQAVAEGRVSVNEERPTLKKDGSVFYADITGHPIVYNGRRCVLALFRDVTERRRAEEALRQSHEQLQAIDDGMVDGFAIFDIGHFRTIRANTALCNMLGYSEEELKVLSPEQKHPLDAHPKIKAHYEAVLEGRESHYDAMPCLRKDGSLLHFDVASRHISYNGRPCLLLFFHDVTERKQAQEALERERQSLWRMLQASDHERQIISYDIHDGLAQYLAGAGMQFQAHDALKENSPEEAKTAYQTAVELVRQAHFEARRLINEVRPPVIDENGIETAIAHLVHEQRRRGGPQIECRSAVQFGRLPSILENALYRIAQEALANACKHSKSKKVTVTMDQEGHEVRLEVRDWGIGFDPEVVGKGHFGVEGIRQRVRLLGGRLTIESTPGSGTMIQAVVPILERQSEG